MSNKHSRGQERLWEGHKVTVRKAGSFFSGSTPWVQNKTQVFESSIQRALCRVSNESCLFLENTIWQAHIRSHRMILFSPGDTGYLL